MKLIYGLILLCLLNIQCKQDDRILFDFYYQQDLTLPAGLSFLQTHYFQFDDIPTNFSNLLKAKGYTIKDIAKVSPGSGYMLALDSGVNLDFIQEVSIMISSTGQFNKEVLYSVQVPLNAGNHIDLAGTLVDALDVLSKDRFNLRISFKLRANCPETFDARFTIKFLAL
ncbi:MAG TPA: hypothetical protein PKN57_05480 [Saprospiraceae bacterium]|nr:hypothetical protein [Saprospiraceae bacterium]MCC6687941.1 hypothetical protein [Saprospiraceae bacterium]HMV24912.1 hypothetical protein [Saprospiraceae bacterium]HMX83168.1 hypothetical protein [Saprospiraceae bacterium]HMZ72646.1 hypothetical protein [Saprospiraceae bacterium]